MPRRTNVQQNRKAKDRRRETYQKKERQRERKKK